MGTCVSRCYPCSSSSSSTAGEHSLSFCGGGSPTLSDLHTVKHAVAVHPLPVASSSPAPTTSTSSLLSAASSSNSMATSSSLLSASSSSNSMVTSSSSATTRTCSSSSSAGYLKVRTCRDMEVVVLDPNRNKKKHSRPSSATPRPLLTRTAPALSVVRSPTKKKPGTTTTTTSNSRRKTTLTARRVRPLPPRSPPAGAWAGAGGSASCRNMRLSASSSSCRSRSADLDGTRKSGGETSVVGGEFLDDLNNPLISMDCFIFL